MSQQYSAAGVVSPSPTQPATLYNAFVGRQPIYTRACEVFAYELLFRSSDVQHARVQDGNEATAHVLVNTFLELGLETLVGKKRAFINVTRDFLLQDFSAVFPAEQVVLEILEDVPVDDEVIQAVRALSHNGYTIALDDFLYQEHLRPLVELADIIKIDVLALDRAALREHVQLLRQYDVQLLAEKVETQEDVTYCRELGFDYFQGYFFCRPDVVKGQRSPTNRLVILELLAKLQNPTTSFEELETLISRDVSLSYKILRLANTAYYARNRQVQSIHEALLLVGLGAISNIVSLCLLANIDDKPHELLLTAIVRAKMCEQMARTMQWKNSNMFFTVGLLSVLDAFMDRPMQELLSTLPLAEEIRQAIMGYEGQLGSTLRGVLAYEQGDWSVVSGLECPSAAVLQAYLAALNWATEIQSDV